MKAITTNYMKCRTTQTLTLFVLMLSLMSVYGVSLAQDDGTSEVYYDPAVITIEKMEAALKKAGTYLGTVKK